MEWASSVYCSVWKMNVRSVRCIVGYSVLLYDAHVDKQQQICGFTTAHTLIIWSRSLLVWGWERSWAGRTHLSVCAAGSRCGSRRTRPDGPCAPAAPRASQSCGSKTENSLIIAAVIWRMPEGNKAALTLRTPLVRFRPLIHRERPLTKEIMIGTRRAAFLAN